MTTWMGAHLKGTEDLLAWLADAERTAGAVSAVVARLAGGLTAGHRILACGNGGSMAAAMHLAEELTGRYRHDRPAFAAQAISDPCHLTCVGNDWSFEHVFARAIEAWGRAGDCLVLFSTSGNSPNIVAAAEAARRQQMTVVGLLGRDGGRVAALCDERIVVPGADSARIQEIHGVLVHLLVEGIERALVPHLYSRS